MVLDLSALMACVCVGGGEGALNVSFKKGDAKDRKIILIV